VNRRQVSQAVVIGGLAVILSGGRALAHARLASASPSPGAVLHGVTDMIDAVFSRPLDSRNSVIVVRNENGRRVDRGDVHCAPDHPKQLRVGLNQLVIGTYHVHWHAVTADGHTADGSYEFRVAAAGAGS
jgi:methionine-rich copper-binding protein CopC